MPTHRPRRPPSTRPARDADTVMWLQGRLAYLVLPSNLAHSSSSNKSVYLNRDHDHLGRQDHHHRPSEDTSPSRAIPPPRQCSHPVRARTSSVGMQEGRTPRQSVTVPRNDRRGPLNLDDHSPLSISSPRTAFRPLEPRLTLPRPPPRRSRTDTPTWTDPRHSQPGIVVTRWRADHGLTQLLAPAGEWLAAATTRKLAATPQFHRIPRVASCPGDGPPTRRPTVRFLHALVIHSGAVCQCPVAPARRRRPSAS